MVMQAWGSYGTLWPVVHQWLGVSPDAGRGRVSVVPQVPAGQTEVSGRRIRVGDGSVAVHAERTARATSPRWSAVARSASPSAPWCRRAPGSAWSASTVATSRPRVVQTARGTEVRYRRRRGRRDARLVVHTPADRRRSS